MNNSAAHNPAAQAMPHHHTEEILVVKRSVLFPQTAWQGIKTVDFATLLPLIARNQEFHPRFLMETDPTYKQVIPYLIFTHAGRYFLMQRHKQASEARLQSKLSLGIGGHIRKEDMTSTSNIVEWAAREFHEEVNYAGTLEIEPIGILNDDSNDVGKVHVGFVLLLHGDSDEISIRSELQSGELVSLTECLEKKDRMETWSQMVLDWLSKNS